MSSPIPQQAHADPAIAISECLNTIDTYGVDPVGAPRGCEFLSTVEIWKYDDDTPSTYSVVNEDDHDTLRAWADRSPPIRGGRQPVAGMKLLIADGHVAGAREWEKEEEELKVEYEKSGRMTDLMRYVSKSFNIPTVFFAADEHNPRFWRLPRTVNGDLEVNEKYYANLCDFAIGWSFHPKTRIARGVLIFKDVNMGCCRDKLLLDLDKGRESVGQVGFLPFAMADAAAYTQSNGLRRLGYHISKVDESIDEVLLDRSPDFGVNLAELSAKTTFGAAKIAISQRALHTSLEMMRFFSEPQAIKGPAGAGQEQLSLEAGSKAVLDGLHCLRKAIESLMMNAEIYQNRMSNQLTTILSLISQRDQAIGIEIARATKSIALESKRDSSSMKTIAAMTMVFLPGTSVASIFAMPFFNWKATGPGVVDPQLWIYFVITIPLTILTFVVWWAWFTMKSRRESWESDSGAGSERDAKESRGRRILGV